MDHVWRVGAEKLSYGTPEFTMTFYPVLAYWMLAAVYDFLTYLRLPWIEKFRIHTREEEAKKNRITKTHVILRVLLQHALQVALQSAFIILDPGQCDALGSPPLTRRIVSFITAMIVLDGWQYFIHRAAHESKFLYRTVHSTHHKLNIPYAYGALYNHPAEAFFLDSVGGLVSILSSGMDCQTTTYFVTFATMKTVFDHCGYTFPINPVYYLFSNNSLYHDVHHDVKGIKRNYSQPFFTIWDRMFGTYTDPTEFDQARKKKE